MVRVLAVLCALFVNAAPVAAQTAQDVFSNDVLHDVQLRVNARDWESLRRNFQLDVYYPAHFVWAGTTVRDVAIRSRGFGSRNGVKPGLEIEFNRYRDSQRFAGLRSVILDNHWQDPSMMRERISMLLYQRLGWPAPREAHVRLWVNDEYIGLYSLVEDIDEDFLTHHFGLGQDAIDESAYLYEYHWRYEYNFSYLGGELEKYEEIFGPKIKDHKSMSELFGPIEDMIRTVNESVGDFSMRVGEFLNLPDLMTFLAISNFLADSDGFLGDFGVNNFYLPRIGERRFDRLIPWDKDNAMVFDSANPSRAVNFPILFRFDQNVLTRKAIADGSLRAAYLNELLRAADSSAPWMEGEINRQFERIRDAALADPSKQFSNAQFIDAVDFLRQFARQRPASVRVQVAQAR